MVHVNQDVQVTHLVLKGSLVNNTNAWNLVVTIQIVMVPISIVTSIIKYVMTNVQMMVIAVKDIIVQILVNVWNLVKIIKTAFKGNIAMKMESIAK